MVDHARMSDSTAQRPAADADAMDVDRDSSDDEPLASTVLSRFTSLDDEPMTTMADAASSDDEPLLAMNKGASAATATPAHPVQPQGHDKPRTS